jgi:pectate lyase
MEVEMSAFAIWNFIHGRAGAVAVPARAVALAGCLAAAGCAQDATEPHAPELGVAASAVVIDPSTTYSFKGVGSGKCIQPRGGSPAAGTPSVIQTCSGGVAQRYAFLATSTSGFFTVRSASSGNCLAVQGASAASGALITHETCSGGTEQQWAIQDPGTGSIGLTARSSGLSLDVVAGGTANGTEVQQWGFGSQTNQLFQLVDNAVGAPPPPSPTTNVFASATGQVDVFVNGVALGRSTATAATLGVGAALSTGAENIIVLRATRGAAAAPFALAEIDSAAGKAGSSALWKAKVAVGTEATAANGPWTALGFDDTSWSTATAVNGSPGTGFPAGGPASGMWSASASDATVLFRLKLFLPAGASAARPVGFASGVTGGAGGEVVTVTTTAALAAAVAGNTPRVVQVSGVIDFTGTEGTTTAASCFQAQCSDGTFEYITNDLGACTSAGKPTFNVTLDKAGKTALPVGSNKTIIGIGRNATIRGKGLTMTGGVSNIAIRNLTITSINPQIVWGGDALTIDNADRVWIDHVRVSLIGRQFFVTGFGAATNVTLSWDDFDGRTPFSATCNGSHYWFMLTTGANDTITVANSWIHNTSGRGPHAGGSTPHVTMHFLNDYYDTVPGHAADPATNSDLLYEGSYFRNVTTPVVIEPTDAGSAFVPLGGTVASTDAACRTALGRPCTANFATPQVGTFPLAQHALTAFGAAPRGDIPATYPAAEVPNVVPHLAGPGHL